MREPLPNCPFCGQSDHASVVSIAESFRVYCGRCQTWGPGPNETAEAAVRRWGTRPMSAGLASAVALAAEAIEHNDEAFSVRKIVATGSWAATIGTTMAAYPSLAAALRALAGEGAEGA
jgi:hypothetical protein